MALAIKTLWNSPPDKFPKLLFFKMFYASQVIKQHLFASSDGSSQLRTWNQLTLNGECPIYRNFLGNVSNFFGRSFRHFLQFFCKYLMRFLLLYDLPDPLGPIKSNDFTLLSTSRDTPLNKPLIPFWRKTSVIQL